MEYVTLPEILYHQLLYIIAKHCYMYHLLFSHHSKVLHIAASYVLAKLAMHVAMTSNSNDITAVEEIQSTR